MIRQQADMKWEIAKRKSQILLLENQCINYKHTNSTTDATEKSNYQEMGELRYSQQMSIKKQSRISSEGGTCT